MEIHCFLQIWRVTYNVQNDCRRIDNISIKNNKKRCGDGGNQLFRCLGVGICSLLKTQELLVNVYLSCSCQVDSRYLQAGSFLNFAAPLG